MSDFHHAFTIDQQTMDMIRGFYWSSIHSIHSTTGSSNSFSRKRITYFSFENVALSPEMQAFYEKFSFLSKNCLVSEFEPGEGTGVHIDGRIASENRMSAINFPIEGCTQASPIIFYGAADSYPAVFDDSIKTTIPVSEDGIIERDRVDFIDQPVLLNTKAWHLVSNNSFEKRIVFSIACNPGVDFATAKQLLLNM